ncbi:MAG TPA: MFS transporter, partial [Acidimicrobiales bacterium]
GGITQRTFSSLKVRNYRLYFFGQAVSMCGTWMQTVGQAWLVLKLTGSGTALGLVIALQFLPVLILGPFGGVLVDRLPKRRVLFITQLASALPALILGVLVSTNTVQLWQVYVLAACLGLVATVDNPIRQTFVLEMVGPENLSNAVTLNSVMLNAARIIGPAIAGLLIATVGLAACFYINAASYLAVLVALGLMKVGELTVVPPTRRAKGQLREGFHYVWSTPVLRDSLTMMAIVGTLSYEFQVLLPLLAKYTFNGTAATYSALTAAMGAGAVVGGLITASRHRHGPMALVKATLALGAVILVAAAAPTLVFELAALVAVGAASITFLSLGTTVLQLGAAPEMRGRVMGLWAVAFIGSTPVGGPIIGWIGQHAGPRIGLVVGGSAALVAGMIGLAAALAARRHLVAARSPDPAPVGT